MSLRLLALVLASLVLLLSSVPAAGPSTQMDPVIEEALELIRSTSYGRILLARNDDLTYQFDAVWKPNGKRADGAYQHWSRAVFIDEVHRGSPVAVVAYIIAHDLGHAQSDRAGQYLRGEEWLEKEAEAERIAAQWWCSKYGERGNPLDDQVVQYPNLVARLLRDDLANETNWFEGHVRWHRADDCGASRIKSTLTPTPTPIPTFATAAM